MAGKPIPITEADDMIKRYYEYMRGLGVNMDHQTQNVAFSRDDFKYWLDDVLGHIDEIRLCMGVYPEGHQYAGRTTVIIWPYKDGKPANRPYSIGKDGGGGENIPPYNDGHGTP